MKRIIYLIVVVLAVFASCSKNESINNPFSSDNQGESKYTPPIMQSLSCFYWYVPRSVNDCDTTCWSHHLCYITVGCEDGYPMEIKVNDGEISSLIIPNYQSLPNNVVNAFDKFIEDGSISFKYECIIEDSALLSLLKQDFIPSGEYPISVNDKDIVIQISCQPIN